MNAWLEKFWVPLRGGHLAQIPRILWAGAAAALIAVAAVVWLWAGGTDYATLYTNLDDADGGAIVTALGKMNVPYTFDKASGALLVPADSVRRTRLLLAAQGLPKGGNAGFELLDKPQFGASRFMEHVTYERALEGELARTIESLHAVSRATVHVATPSPSLFVRDQKTPTASVLLTLQPGRTLSGGQVNAIAWLVSSSVPELTADHVSIVDQYGNLLSSGSGASGAQADAAHLAYQQRLEESVARSIQNILTPLVGAGNVRAEASARVDFARVERTTETYEPTGSTARGAIRSEQTQETNRVGTTAAQGVPGALSNQPPPNAQTTITNPRGPAAGTAPGNGTTPRDDSRSSTINYELNHQITHEKPPVGELRQLSVAVVVNDATGPGGAVQPLDAKRLEQMTGLIKQAMGYSAQRGDTLSVVGSPFLREPALDWWRDPYWLNLARQVGTDLLGILLIWIAWRKGLRPFAKAWARSRPAPLPPANLAAVQQEYTAELARKADRYEDDLKHVREIADKDPRAVAMVMRMWMEKAQWQ